MAETNAPRGKGSLWRSFVTIAQPYFFPGIRGGAWVTLLLMIALLVFLFGLLFMMVAGMTWAAARTAPDLSTKVAPGLVSLIDGIFHY